jgi:hypothetical protein
MKKVIGFATEYYTLWEVWSTKRYAGNVVMNGVPPPCIGINLEYFYIKNISKDIEKVKALYPGVEIDEDLRGVTRSFSRFEKIDYPLHMFSFGKCAGGSIMESTDIWQLKRAAWMILGHSGEPNKRRQVLARRRLIQLGELIRYPHTQTKSVNVNWNKRDADGVYLPENIQDVEYRVNYATAQFIERDIEKKRLAAQPFYFNDGEKVTIRIRQTGQFGFESQYGWTSIRVYETDDGKCVKYVGASPIELPDTTNFHMIKATIKHKEFRGNKETHLLRIKLL